MFIKEIELDLPYQENMFFISKIQCKENCIMKEVEIVSNIEPDERVYDEFLCSLEWQSTTEVILKTKFGGKYIASL